MNFKTWIENTEFNNYPTVKWVKSSLRNSLVAPMRITPLACYIVGSEARGLARPDSDLDIAVVISKIRGKTALQFTENYQSKFLDDKLKPRWNGRVVDFQFFYEDDPELQKYSKIKLI
jgi:predicted nucleotidyltransferase